MKTILSIKFVSIFLVGILISACAVHRGHELPKASQGEAMQLPKWFWKPPAGKVVAVGYSRFYDLHPEVSILKAIEDGKSTLAKQMGVHIFGERISWDKLMVEKLEEKAVRQLSEGQSEISKIHETSDVTIVAVATDGEQQLPDRLVAAKNLKKPKWIESSPKEGQYIYGVGRTEEKYPPANNWRRAEKNARVALAFNYKTLIQGFHQDYSGVYGTISSSKIDIKLRAIEIVERWFDVKTQTYYILARVAKPEL